MGQADHLDDWTFCPNLMELQENHLEEGTVGPTVSLDQEKNHGRLDVRSMSRAVWF